MTILMVAPMALTMLRNQALVGDDEFINSMIPHHSSAILVSEEARITDLELKKLAEEIIKTQKEEIAEMERILKLKDRYKTEERMLVFY